MDWHEQEASLEKLQKDLAQSWEHLRAIAKHETFTDSISTEKKMKSAQFLTEAAERLKVLEVIHRRVVNRFNKLYLFMGLNPAQAEQQSVGLQLLYTHNEHLNVTIARACTCSADVFAFIFPCK